MFASKGKSEVYEKRMQSKQWQTTRSRLTIIHAGF